VIGDGNEHSLQVFLQIQMTRRAPRRRLDCSIEIIAEIILNDRWYRDPGVKAYGSTKLIRRDIGGFFWPLLKFAFDEQI